MGVIALDLGGTKLASAIFENEKIIRGDTHSVNKLEGYQVLEVIIEQVKEYIAFAEQNNIELKAAGVCVPGIAYSDTGNVWAPNIKGWENFPLLTELTRAVPNNIKIKIDSDRACYILGEVWQGSARDAMNAIYLAVGTGIGAGILINGEVLRGAHDIAGAIGWLALDRPYQKKYDSCGCFEYHASGEGIAKVAREMLSSETNYSGKLRELKLEEITSRDIFEAYENGDQLAAKTFDISIEFWGMAAANLVSLFNPEKIIFGGGVFGPAVKFIDRIYAESKKWAQPISINQVKFISSSLGTEAGLYGAGYLALKDS